MEPWQEAELRELRQGRKVRVRCVVCGEAIFSERCLNLEDFGLQGYGCERCVDQNTVYTVDVNE